MYVKAKTIIDVFFAPFPFCKLNVKFLHPVCSFTLSGSLEVLHWVVSFTLNLWSYIQCVVLQKKMSVWSKKEHDLCYFSQNPFVLILSLLGVYFCLW